MQEILPDMNILYDKHFITASQLRLVHVLSCPLIFVGYIHREKATYREFPPIIVFLLNVRTII